MLYKDGQEIDRHTVRVNDPLRYDGLTFYQAFFGAAAIMTVKDADGRRSLVQSEGVPLACETDDEGRTFGIVPIPGTRLHALDQRAPLGGSDPGSSPARCGSSCTTAGGASAFADPR